MSKYISPLTDFGFKKLFGEEDSKEYLIDFLNSILDGEIAYITEIKDKDTNMLGQQIADRNSIFDLYCITKNGERILVELQNERQPYFTDRSLFYSSLAIQEQAKKGEWQYKLEKVYFIGILNFKFNESKDYIHYGGILNTKTHEVLIDKLSFTFIELPKFKKEIQKNSSHQDKWLYLISKLEELDETPQELDEKIYHDFIHKAQVTALNKKEFDNYQASLKRYRDNYAIEKHKLDEAEAIGVAKGIEQGIEKGEHVKALQIAKSMKLKGYDINLIIDLTGLSKNDIDSI